MTPRRSQSPEPAGAGQGRPRRVARHVVRGALWLFLALGAILIYLQLVGIPGAWAAGVMHLFEDRGVYLDARRISLDLRRGVVVDGCRMYNEPSRRVPMLEAESVAFRLDRRAALGGRLRLREISVQDGRLRVGGRRPEQTGPSVDLEHVEGRLSIESDGLEVEHLALFCLGVRVQGHGRIDLQGPGAGRDEVQAKQVGPGEIGALLEHAPSWLAVIMDQMGKVDFAAVPDVAVEFVLRPGVEHGSLVRFRGEAGRTLVRGLAFDAWAFEGSLQGSQLTCRRAYARAGDERLVVSGSYDLKTRMTEARVDSSLSPVYLEGLMPIGWRDRMDETGLYFAGAIHMEASLGSEVPGRLLDSFAGRLRLAQADLRDVWLERADLRFRLEGERLIVPSFTAVIGKDAMQGPARGTFAMDLNTRAIEGTLHAEFDWAEFLPVLSGGAARAIRLMQFNEKPPVTDVRFAGRPGGPEGLFLEGTLAADAFMYRGTYVNRFHTGICLTNRVLTLAPLRAERDEGFAEGLVAIDFEDRRVDLDLFSTADPPAAARTGGEAVTRIVNRFRFEGPTEATMKGSVYWGTNGVSTLHAKATGQHLGLKWFTADEASFDFQLLGKEALVSNFVCRAYGGEGQAEVRVAPDGDRWRFEADLRARGMAFGEVARLAMHSESPPHPGSLDMNGRFTGLLGDDFLHSLKGKGTVNVAEARLLQVPLFFGLSQGLSRIYPGLGFATQNEFKASFEVQDQRVFTRDARLEGSVLGLTADGSYGLADKDLDFEVEVRLLREHGVASSLVHLVTSPLSKLLQFDLRGTLEQPRWRPNNLPKELFLMFD